jgi:hypothetical protein
MEVCSKLCSKTSKRVVFEFLPSLQNSLDFIGYNATFYIEKVLRKSPSPTSGATPLSALWISTFSSRETRK